MEKLWRKCSGELRHTWRSTEIDASLVTKKKKKQKKKKEKKSIETTVQEIISDSPNIPHCEHCFSNCMVNPAWRFNVKIILILLQNWYSIKTKCVCGRLWNSFSCFFYLRVRSYFNASYFQQYQNASTLNSMYEESSFISTVQVLMITMFQTLYLSHVESSLELIKYIKVCAGLLNSLQENFALCKLIQYN